MHEGHEGHSNSYISGLAHKGSVLGLVYNRAKSKSKSTLLLHSLLRIRFNVHKEEIEKKIAFDFAQCK